MNQTIKLDTRKREGKYGEARIAPLRRGERNNALLTVKICANGAPYDLTGKTASLVATTAAGKLVGPYPMECVEAGIVRIMLPAALYSAVGAFTGYVEIREGETLVDTTDSFGGKVIECADLDAEQAEEYKPLLGELQNAVAEEAKRAEAEKARAQAETERVAEFAEAKQAAQTATQKANTAATEAKKAAGSASAAAESANTAATKADSAAKKAETAAETADAANTAANKAVGDAQAAIAEVKATEAKLYPAAENILVGGESGTVAHVEDAFEGAALRKITVEGAAKQDGIPSPEEPKPITAIEHPTVKVVGRNLIDVRSDMPESDCSKDFSSSVKRIILPGTYVVGLTMNNYLSANNIEDLSIGDGSISFTGKEVGYGVGIGVDLLPGETYIDKSTRYHSYYSKDGSFIKYDEGERFTVPADARYVVAIFRPEKSNSSVSVKNIAIAHVSDGGSYKPYTSQSLTFTLPAEHPYLAKLPDGTADEIVVDAEGNVELVARVGVDKNVREVGDFAQGQYYALRTNIAPYASASIPSSVYGRHVLCNALPYKNAMASGDGIYRTWNGIYVKDTSGRTKEEIQAEVDKNAPLTVVAVMPETRYPLGKIDMPKAQDSIVNVWTDAEVTPNTGIEYVRDVNIVVAHLEAAIASITEG